MPDLLSDLNPQQIQAVTASPGPTLIVAGPGSGKTRVLTHRIAWLVQQGTPPFRIMAVTFTNKAAREMRDRVEKLLGGALGGLTIGTFHSICARFLRREASQHPERSPEGAQSKGAPLLDVTRDFVIFDDSDQLAVVKQAMEHLKIDDKQYRPQSLLGAISKAKNELVPPEDYPIQTYNDEIRARVYVEYQKRLRENNALDFDDLLTETVYLFRRYPDVLKKYQDFYDHVLVDEFQDTNTAQYALVKLITATKRNLYVVGDPDQCFPSSTPIQTETGPKPIDQILKGDCVIAASGRGAAMPTRVNHVEQRAYTGKLLRVRTRNGQCFRATPNHIVFARLGRNPGLHYVYLMYRRDKGYRIGIAAHTRSDGVSADPQIGLKVRSNQENADSLWVLRVCSTREEAQYWEALYAFRYGVPTTVFHVRGRRMGLTQEAIDRLYREIDTETNALRLMADLNINRRFPHYLPQGTSRNVVNLRYFGDARRSQKSPWNAHRIDLWSNNPAVRARLEAHGYHPRNASRQNWRVGYSRLHYDEAQTTARELSAHMGGAPIITGAFLVDMPNKSLAPRFSLMPVSHLHPSMIVAIERDGNIVEDEVVEVAYEDYTGLVYDLEVDTLHNYLAGGIVVHNSIYRWRGADYRNVRRFQDDNPDAVTILLEQNYRSTQLILDAAMAVIDRNKGRTRKELFTEREGGAQIQFYEAYNEEEEALYAIQTIATLTARDKISPSDVAIMYRTNAQSRAFEDAFVRANLPYRIVGAQRFYGRREVKDLIAFLRLVHNPADSVSLLRVINVPPRGLGAKTLETLQAAAERAGVPLSAILRDLGLNRLNSGYAAEFKGKAGAALSEFGEMLNNWIAIKESMPVAKLMDRILSDIDYRRYINDGSEEGEARWENVMELRGVALETESISLTAFLEEIALVADADTLNEGAGPTLLTLHAAKGLEFPVVFISGLNEKVLPHQRSLDDAEEMAEERRLMYVGLTRAKDRLFLTRPHRITSYGNYDVADASRFLNDIPGHLLLGKPSRRAGADSAFARMTTWDTDTALGRGGSRTRPTHTRPAQRESLPTESRYRTGQRVKHPSFGEGMIIESKGSGDDEIVVIAFEATGIKRLAANMVELKILKN